MPAMGMPPNTARQGGGIGDEGTRGQGGDRHSTAQCGTAFAGDREDRKKSQVVVHRSNLYHWAVIYITGLVNKVWTS